MGKKGKRKQTEAQFLAMHIKTCIYEDDASQGRPRKFRKRGPKKNLARVQPYSIPTTQEHPWGDCKNL